MLFSVLNNSLRRRQTYAVYVSKFMGISKVYVDYGVFGVVFGVSKSSPVFLSVSLSNRKSSAHGVNIAAAPNSTANTETAYRLI